MHTSEMTSLFDLKALKKLYFSNTEKNEFAKKLERIAEFIDKEQCLSEGIEFLSQVNEQIVDNPRCNWYIGNIYRVQGQYKASLQFLQKAMTMLDEKNLRFEVLYSLGMLYREHDQLIDAKHCFEEILSVYPQSPMVQYSLSCLLIYEGRFHEGWKKHNWRIQLDEKMQQLKNYFQLPEWKNKSESRILILTEQGVGDKIMFAAFLSLLPENRQYTVVVSTRLVAIFKRSFPTLHIVEGTQENIFTLKQQPFDAYCFMGCLPKILHVPTPKGLTFLTSAPYICKRYSENLRVGISWRGGIGIERKKRSIDLLSWLPILKTPNIHFVNLQYDAQQAEIATMQSHNITIESDASINALNDMDAFASLVSSCDIVITVDNSTAHLAGALGISTWVLLPSAPNWRWKKQGDSSYWYQSVRIFRQNTIRQNATSQSTTTKSATTKSTTTNRCWDDLIQHVQEQLINTIN